MESGGTDGTELQGRPVILLTSIGAKTGKIRKTPLMRVEHDGEYAIVASLGASAITGVLFGMLPAMKASKLDPVDALRYE